MASQPLRMRMEKLFFGWLPARMQQAPKAFLIQGIPMKAVWKDVVVAESDDTVVVEGNHYFPESALHREYFTFSNHKTTCAWKGQASYMSLLVNGEMNTDAAWFYADPKPEAAEIKGRVAFWKGVKVTA